MVECSFCGTEMKKSTGKMVVFDNGIIKHYCSSKCEKNNLSLGRDPRKFKWTKSYAKGGLKKKK